MMDRGLRGAEGMNFATRVLHLGIKRDNSMRSTEQTNVSMSLQKKVLRLRFLVKSFLKGCVCSSHGIGIRQTVCSSLSNDVSYIMSYYVIYYVILEEMITTRMGR